jgi:hypothetical protein
MKRKGRYEGHRVPSHRVREPTPQTPRPRDVGTCNPRHTRFVYLYVVYPWGIFTNSEKNGQTWNIRRLGSLELREGPSLGKTMNDPKTAFHGIPSASCNAYMPPAICCGIDLTNITMEWCFHRLCTQRFLLGPPTLSFRLNNCPGGF